MFLLSEEVVLIMGAIPTKKIAETMSSTLETNEETIRQGFNWLPHQETTKIQRPDHL